MHRTQILLGERQYEAIKSRARHENRSLSDLVRRAVDQILGNTKHKGHQLRDICGIAKDSRGPSGRDHNKALYS